MKNNITSCVYYLIHVKTPHVKEAQLFITNCPDDLTSNSLRKLLAEAGYYFEEFGIEWANHRIKIGLADDVELKRQFINKKVDYRHHMDVRPWEVDIIDFEDLNIKSLINQSIN